MTVAGLALIGISASVQASPINGTINFGGGSAAFNGSFAGGTETEFTAISAKVEAGTTTGDYASLTGGETGTFTPFVFADVSPATPWICGR